MVVAVVAALGFVAPALAQWPTTCVELNDIVENHLGNRDNVGIYQRVFGGQAEQACQNDHRDDVRGVFAWAFDGPAAADSSPPTPTPEPTATPTPEPTPEPASIFLGACRVGQTLREGDSCTIDIPRINMGTNRFEIRNGSGCYGGICAGRSVNLNGFRASRSGSTWTIDSLPGTSGEPVATTRPTPVQEPVSITEFNRASLSTRLSMFEEGRIAKCQVGLVLPRDGFCIDPDAESIRPPNTVRFLAAHLSDGSGLVMGEAWVFGRSPGTITLIGTNVEFGWISGTVFQSRTSVDNGSITAEKQGVDWVITDVTGS